MFWLYMMVAGWLFGIGLFGVMIRRNLIVILLCVELMLTAVSIIFVSAGQFHNLAEARLYVFFILSVSAAEVAVGLSIVLALYRRHEILDVDELSELKW